MTTTVREHVLRQGGVISLAQARQAGMTYRQIQHKVQTAEWLTVRGSASASEWNPAGAWGSSPS